MVKRNPKSEARNPKAANPFRSPLSALRFSGFTLTELMIAIAIFVIVLAMAVPVFRGITGSRSVAAATNVLSAELNRVRMEAIGFQQYRAALFFLDQNTGRVGIVTLKQLDNSQVLAPTTAKEMGGGVFPGATPDVWFDLVPDSEPVLLPVGIGLETVIGNTPGGNRYIGFNDVCDFTKAAYYTCQNRPGGVVAFDKFGRLMTGVPGIVWWNNITSPGSQTALGSFLFGTNYTPGSPAAEPSGSSMFYPTLCFSLFESEPYLLLPKGNRLEGSPLKDGFEDDYHSPMPTTEAQRETWLDNNATPFLINRYNGTLIKGE